MNQALAGTPHQAIELARTHASLALWLRCRRSSGRCRQGCSRPWSGRNGLRLHQRSQRSDVDRGGGRLQGMRRHALLPTVLANRRQPVQQRLQVRQGVAGRCLFTTQRVEHLVERGGGLLQVTRHRHRQPPPLGGRKLDQVFDPVRQPAHPAHADDVAAALEGVRHPLRFLQFGLTQAIAAQRTHGRGQSAHLFGRIGHEGFEQVWRHVVGDRDRHVVQAGEQRLGRHIVDRQLRRQHQPAQQLVGLRIVQRQWAQTQPVHQIQGGLAGPRFMDAGLQAAAPGQQPAQAGTHGALVHHGQGVHRVAQVHQGQCQRVKRQHAQRIGQTVEVLPEHVRLHVGRGGAARQPGHQAGIDVIGGLRELFAQHLEQVLQPHGRSVRRSVAA